MSTSCYVLLAGGLNIDGKLPLHVIDRCNLFIDFFLSRTFLNSILICSSSFTLNKAVNLKGKRLLRISQEECDALMEAVFKEEGAYPDS